MKVITDKEYVRDYIDKKLDEILDKLSKDEDISIERKYIGTKVVKELEEAELTDDEVVNLYNAFDYDKFVNLIGALESTGVLNCGNTNEMIRKLTIIIWCHYENSVDTDIIDNIIDDTNVMTTLDEIASHLKDEEDKENTTLEPGFNTDNFGDFDDELGDSPFGSSPFGSSPFGSSSFDDIFKEDDNDIDNNTNKDSDKQKEIKKAYKKLEKAIDMLKDIIDGD